jgi:hypothetical protein
MKTIGELQHEYLERLLLRSPMTIKHTLYILAILNQYEVQRRSHLKEYYKND